MNVLIVVNGSAYGTELPFNALRLATALVKRDAVDVRVFLMGDAVVSAVAGQELPDGYYHLDRMVASVLRHGAQVGCCGSCTDARAIGENRLVEGAARSSMEQLADWTLEADRTVTF
ncbi:MAG: DsrE family protein [Acidimicrobiales bacterium]|nr:DsrE family protein [Acidimicrobiales bacterium]